MLTTQLIVERWTECAKNIDTRSNSRAITGSSESDAAYIDFFRGWTTGSYYYTPKIFEAAFDIEVGWRNLHLAGGRFFRGSLDKADVAASLGKIVATARQADVEFVLVLGEITRTKMPGKHSVAVLVDNRASRIDYKDSWGVDERKIINMPCDFRQGLKQAFPGRTITDYPIRQQHNDSACYLYALLNSKTLLRMRGQRGNAGFEDKIDGISDLELLRARQSHGPRILQLAAQENSKGRKLLLQEQYLDQLERLTEGKPFLPIAARTSSRYDSAARIMRPGEAAVMTL